MTVDYSLLPPDPPELDGRHAFWRGDEFPVPDAVLATFPREAIGWLYAAMDARKESLNRMKAEVDYSE